MIFKSKIVALITSLYMYLAARPGFLATSNINDLFTIIKENDIVILIILNTSLAQSHR